MSRDRIKSCFYEWIEWEISTAANVLEENIDAAHMELVFPFSELSVCH